MKNLLCDKIKPLLVLFSVILLSASSNAVAIKIQGLKLAASITNSPKQKTHILGAKNTAGIYDGILYDNEFIISKDRLNIAFLNSPGGSAEKRSLTVAQIDPTCYDKDTKTLHPLNLEPHSIIYQTPILFNADRTASRYYLSLQGTSDANLVIYGQPNPDTTEGAFPVWSSDETVDIVDPANPPFMRLAEGYLRLFHYYIEDGSSQMWSSPAPTEEVPMAKCDVPEPTEPEPTEPEPTEPEPTDPPEREVVTRDIDPIEISFADAVVSDGLQLSMKICNKKDTDLTGVKFVAFPDKRLKDNADDVFDPEKSFDIPVGGCVYGEINKRKRPLYALIDRKYTDLKLPESTRSGDGSFSLDWYVKISHDTFDGPYQFFQNYIVVDPDYAPSDDTDTDADADADAENDNNDADADTNQTENTTPTTTTPIASTDTTATTPTGAPPVASASGGCFGSVANTSNAILFGLLALVLGFVRRRTSTI